MHLVALASNGRLTPADRAKKGTEYVCLECGSVVRLRKGREIRAHYYHPPNTSHCHQSKKSLAHLQTQIYIQEKLPTNEAEIEVPFPSIHRIADVAWHNQKVIFEIQCSPISQEEVAARNRDYGKEGYRVIWIFHERNFNKSKIRGAEHHVWHKPHYFTNINAQGEGDIYDQYSVETKGRRSHRFSRFPICISSLDSSSKQATFTKRSQKRLAAWPHTFKGEMAYCEAHGLEKEKISGVHEHEKNEEPKDASRTLAGIIANVQTTIVFWHRVIFYLLLERVCH